MSIFDCFKGEPQSIKELQAELRALCDKIMMQQFSYSVDADRYERLLKEIYLRGEKPEITLVPKK